MGMNDGHTGQPDSSKPIKVLLVDDSIHDQELIRHSLEVGHGGFDLTVLSAFQDLEELAQQEGQSDLSDCDILLTDFNILGFTGLDVIDKLRRLVSDLPVILVTGTGSEEVAVQALRRGVDDYVIKTPDHIRQLPHRITTILEQQKVKREHEETSQAFRQLVVGSADAMLVVDQESKILFANPAAEELFGSPQKQLLGQRIGLPSWMEGEQEIDIPTGQQTRVGAVSPVPILWYGQQAMLLNIRDITVRKEAEQQVLNLSKMLTHYLETSPSITYALKNMDGRLEPDWVSPNIERLLGYPMEEILQPGWWLQNMHSEDREDAVRRMQSLQENGVLTHRYRFHKSSGEVIWIRDQLQVTDRDNDDRILEAVGSWIDISERIKGEVALKESERKHRIFNEISSIFLTGNDEDMYDQVLSLIQTVLESQLGMFGYLDESGNLICAALSPAAIPSSVNELKGVHFPKEKWSQIWGEVMLERKTVFYNKAYPVPDDHVPIHRYLGVPILYQDTLIGLILVANKSTDYLAGDARMADAIVGRLAPILNARLERDREQAAREKIQAQFNQAQKLESIGRLAGGVAHDFNNMLSIILGYGNTLLEDLHLSDPLRDDVKEIVEAGKRSSALTRQLLAFSRKQTFQPEVIDINGIVRGMEKMLQRLLGEDILLELRLADNLARTKVDPSQLEQVVLNLAVNARDAMVSGGGLVVETSEVELDTVYTTLHPDVEPGPYILLSMADSGSGMEEEVLEQIFEPFFTTKERDKGTGLGLSTVYGIVKQSGGHIGVYSELGIGTTFKVYLPKTGAQSEENPQKPEKTNPRGAGQHLLVVEDEAGLRKLMANVLSRLGYSVTLAANGGEALLLVEEKGLRPALVITDVVMPNMNGKELVDRLRKSQPDLKTIFMSGYTDNIVVRNKIIEQGAIFIQKPFTIKELGEKVSMVLQRT